MPQENVWATGPEHCENGGTTCPYCGSKNTETGGSEGNYPGQLIDGGHCLDCGKTWGNLYNIAGWYDEEDKLHEDTEQMDEAERLKEVNAALLEALESNLQAWEGEEDSVKEEHADLIEETRSALAKARGEVV